jgi:GGDEF domain-containing protein
LLLPGATREECTLRAEAARSAVEDLGKRPRWSAIPARLGITLGIVFWEGDAADSASLIALADQSLYEAKAAGRNRVGTPVAPQRAPV